MILCVETAPIILERMEFPEPVISVAVGPKPKLTKKKWVWLWSSGSGRSSFRVWTDEESGQTIIAGMGELHLEIIVDRMRREFQGWKRTWVKPQVAYRETIRVEAKDVQGKH